MFTGVLCRAQVRYRRGNGPGVGFKGDSQNLTQTGELGTHEPARSWSDMTFHALDSRVSRILISRELRGHNRVARLPTKGRRIHICDTLVRGKREYHDVQKCGNSDEQERVTYSWRLQVDGRKNFRQFSRQTKLSPMKKNPYGDQE